MRDTQAKSNYPQCVYFSREQFAPLAPCFTDSFFFRDHERKGVRFDIYFRTVLHLYLDHLTVTYTSRLNQSGIVFLYVNLVEIGVVE